MKILRCLCVGLAIFSLYSIGLGVGNIYAANLLTNPGAETGDLTGWTIGVGVPPNSPGVDSGSFDPGINPHSGSYDFYGHDPGALGTLIQNVNLLSNGFTTTQINTGTLVANVVFWEQGLNQGPTSDNGSVTLTFLDAGNSILGTATTPTIDSHNLTWEEYSGSFSIPVNTVSIDYTMNFMRNVGTDNDAFFDDNSLTVTGVPLPGAVWLLGSGLLGLVGLRRFRKG